MIKRIFIGFFICLFFICVGSCGGDAVYCSWLDNLSVKVNEIRLTFPSDVFFNSNDLTSFDDVFNYSFDYNNPQIKFTTTAEICSNEKKRTIVITDSESNFVDGNFLGFMPKAYGAESYAHTFCIEIVWDNIEDVYSRRGKLIWEQNYYIFMFPTNGADQLEFVSFCKEGKFYPLREEVFFLPIYRMEQYVVNY